MRGRDVELQLVHQPRKPGRLAFGKVEHQPRESRCVDDRVLERAFQSSTDEPRVERVVAVLHEHSAVSET